MPKVSVIIPTYNSANYLPEAIESVLAQTYKDFELIVIDDGSTDNTKEVVVPYLDRIKFLEGPNGGPSKARNRGIRKSSGEYVAFLDADDIWYPDKLQRQLTVLLENQHYNLIYSDALFTKKDNSQKNWTYLSNKRRKKRMKAGWIFSNLLSECFILVPSVIVKRDCLEKVGLFDEHLKWWEGYDLWLRIAFENQVGFVNTPLFFRRIHDSNLFYSAPLNNIISFITIMKKWDNQALKLNEGDRKTVNQKLRKGYRLLSFHYSVEGKQSEARLALKNSIARGFSLRSVAGLGLAIFPPVAVRYILNVYKHLFIIFNKAEKI